MCRDEALEASNRAAEMRAAGANRIVAVVKEDIGTEVEDFTKDFWKEEVFMDEQRQFYTALGGGQFHKPYSMASFLAMLANPFSKSRTKANVKNSYSKQNMTGEGFVAGGVYVMRRDGSAAFSHLEEELGDKASLDDVIAAVKAAAE